MLQQRHMGGKAADVIGRLTFGQFITAAHDDVMA